MEKEFIEMAQRCSSEIKEMRRAIANLQPKADAYDKLSIVLGLLPQPSQGYGEDIAWKLDKRVEELKAALTAASLTHQLARQNPE